MPEYVLTFKTGDAYRYMHGIGFAHRDIKCENILLNKQRTHAKVRLNKLWNYQTYNIKL